MELPMKVALKVAALTVAAVLASSTAQASLIGQTLVHQCPQCQPPYSQTFLVTDGLGPELTPFNQWALDVEADTIRVTWLENDSRLTSPLDFIVGDILDGISSVSVDPSSTSLPTALSFTNTSVDINLDGGGAVVAQTFILIDVNHQVQRVPEPATAALLLAALSGLALIRLARFRLPWL